MGADDLTEAQALILRLVNAGWAWTVEFDAAHKAADEYLLRHGLIPAED